MTLKELRASLRVWNARHEYRVKKLNAAKAKGDRNAIEKWDRLHEEAHRMVKRRQRQIKARRGSSTKPRIVTAATLGLKFANNFGPLGPETRVTGHYTAGPKDTSDSHGMQLAKSYHGAHAAKGWGGIGYHYMILRSGTILCLRPTYLKGAHVGGHNSQNIGVVCNGTTGDTPTPEQVRSYKWLLSNAHTEAMPRAHRTDRNLRNAKRYGHNSLPGHASNGCPGKFKPMFLEG